MDGHGELATKMDFETAVPPGGRSVVVNGEPCSTDASTLVDLLNGLGYGEAKVATAVNGDFVPARARADRRLNDGDRVEIVAPRQGG